MKPIIFVVWCDRYDAREFSAESPKEAAEGFVNHITENEVQNLLVFVCHKLSGEMSKFRLSKKMTIEAEEFK
jgi:hypothetical protein